MINELTDSEFRETFGESMTDITDKSIDPIDIWPYVRELYENKLINKLVLERELVELVYRNDLETFDHILLPTDFENEFMVIIVNLKTKLILGHHSLNLNEKYGIG